MIARDHPGCVLAEASALGVRIAVKFGAAPAFRVDGIRIAAGSLLIMRHSERSTGLLAPAPRIGHDVGVQLITTRMCDRHMHSRRGGGEHGRMRYSHRQALDVRSPCQNKSLAARFLQL